jgi:hypothetical protein
VEREWLSSNYRNWEEKKQTWPADGPKLFRLESEAFPTAVTGALAPMKEKEKKRYSYNNLARRKTFRSSQREGNEWDGG